jgi:hypothetical protein
MYIAGLDVHQRYVTVGVLDSTGGETSILFALHRV